MTPESFYQIYRADDNLSKLSHELIAKARQYNPTSVLDFGAGSGKHAAAFNRFGIETMAVDLSMMNVLSSHIKHELPCVCCSNERILARLTNFDVVLTCSVLDHIELIDDIIKQFKRIANKVVFLAETQYHNPELMYFYHDYQEMGFKDIGFTWQSDPKTGDGNTYKIWKYVQTGGNHI